MCDLACERVSMDMRLSYRMWPRGCGMVRYVSVCHAYNVHGYFRIRASARACGYS